MNLLVTGSLLCLIGFATADVASEFVKAKIIPDVIDKAPSEEVQVKYESKEVKIGEELAPTQVQNMPDIHFKHEGGAIYILIMTDPDSAKREHLHWMVGNIPDNNTCKGDTIAPYVGSRPPKGSGLHRYVFLVYKQLGELKFDERNSMNSTAEGYFNFSTKKFVAKYNFGEPIAGNLFQAQWNELMSN